MEDLAGEREMTVLVKYPSQTKERNKIFFEKKDQELTNLDWAKWAGWFDTDGTFVYIGKSSDKSQRRRKCADLKLRDRQPVELFSKTFETSLTDWIARTITPDGNKHTATIHQATMRNTKAEWFTKNVYPYLIKEGKKDLAVKLLGYRPESKDFVDWTTDEVIHYLATALEGDGCVRCSSRGSKSKNPPLSLTTDLISNDVQYLSDIKYIADDKLGVLSNLKEKNTYETREGIKTMYRLFILCSRKNPNNLGFFQSLVKNGVMTLDRKKQKVQEYLNDLE